MDALLLMRCLMRMYGTAGVLALPDARAAGSRACAVMRDATVDMVTEEVLPAGAASDALRMCSSAGLLRKYPQMRWETIRSTGNVERQKRSNPQLLQGMSLV